MFKVIDVSDLQIRGSEIIEVNIRKLIETAKAKDKYKKRMKNNTTNKKRRKRR